MRKGQKGSKMRSQHWARRNQVPASGFVWPTEYRNSRARVRLAHLPAESGGFPGGKNTSSRDEPYTATALTQQGWCGGPQPLPYLRSQHSTPGPRVGTVPGIPCTRLPGLGARGLQLPANTLRSDGGVQLARPYIIVSSLRSIDRNSHSCQTLSYSYISLNLSLAGLACET